MKISALLLTFLLLASGFNPATISDRLCKDNETLVCSFYLNKSQKVVSVLKERGGKYLVFRMGTKEKVELEYPHKLDTTSWKAFTFYGVNHGGGKDGNGYSELTLTFTDKADKYVLYQNWVSEQNGYDIGLKVYKNNQENNWKGRMNTRVGSLEKIEDNRYRIKNTFFHE